jgi:hypothetical protein
MEHVRIRLDFILSFIVSYSLKFGPCLFLTAVLAEARRRSLLAEVASVKSQVVVAGQVFRGHAVAEAVVRQAMLGEAAVRHRPLPVVAEAER